MVVDEKGEEGRDRRPFVIAGPTASGKSALAAAVAESVGGTVINADSMQVYRDLAILTARPDDALDARVPHRLYGFLDGGELCSAVLWAEYARAEIMAAQRVGSIAIICGGTGLYLRTLLQGIAIVPQIPDGVRMAARARHRDLGGTAFRDALAVIDPASAAKLHANDRQRLIRAYEVATATGTSLEAWQAGQGENVRLDARCFVLLPSRDALYQAIDQRFHRMVERGALAEVERLLARGLDPALPIMKALGVRELAAHLAGETSLDTAMAEATQATRHYAKRQFTWFRHQFADAEPLFAQLSETNLAQTCQKICNLA